MKVRCLELFNNDIVVHREKYTEFPTHAHDSTRGEITMLSDKSLKRLAFVAANTNVNFNVMVTLTYPREFPVDGARVKRDLKTFIKWARRRQCGEYLWFLEFQRRGAPHFHLLFEGKLDFRGVAEHWYRVVGSEDERHLSAGTRVEAIRVKDGGKRYAVSYASKPYQKEVPSDYKNVGRFWGCSRGVSPKSHTLIFPDDMPLEDVLVGWDYMGAVADRLDWLRVLYGASEVARTNYERLKAARERVDLDIPF